MLSNYYFDTQIAHKLPSVALDNELKEQLGVGFHVQPQF